MYQNQTYWGKPIVGFGDENAKLLKWVMRGFDIPNHFRSPIISRVKAKRKEIDARKQDFSPPTLDFGAVRIQLARHFGCCFGVENAIEISRKKQEISRNLRSRLLCFLRSRMHISPSSHVRSHTRRRKAIIANFKNWERD